MGTGDDVLLGEVFAGARFLALLLARQKPPSENLFTSRFGSSWERESGRCFAARLDARKTNLPPRVICIRRVLLQPSDDEMKRKKMSRRRVWSLSRATSCYGEWMTSLVRGSLRRLLAVTRAYVDRCLLIFSFIWRATIFVEVYSFLTWNINWRSWFSTSTLKVHVCNECIVCRIMQNEMY